MGSKLSTAPKGPQVFDPCPPQMGGPHPEEWVRQHVLGFLVHDLGCPLALIAVEQQLS